MSQDRCVSMTRAWGFIATDVPDPPECVLSCRRDFLRGLALENETLDVVCEALSDTAAATVSTVVSISVSEAASAPSSTEMAAGDEPAFWALYCCDAQRCGVDNLDGGQDPNVNWFINSCQNIGHSSLVDPGPPNQTFRCESNATDHPDSATRCDSRVQNSGEAESDPFPSATTTSVTTQTRSTIHDPSLETSFDPTQSEGNSSSSDSRKDGDPDDGLSTGVKVTIALATLAALVLLVLGILAFLRYRSRPPHRRNLCQYLKDKYHSLYPSTGGALPTPPSPPLSPARPLLSPKLPQTNRDGVPLTPPLPLKERRLLSEANPSLNNNNNNNTDNGRRSHHTRNLSNAHNTFPRTGFLNSKPPSAVYVPNRGMLARRSGSPGTILPPLPPPARSASGPLPGPSAPLSPPSSPRVVSGSVRSISTGPTNSTASTISASRGTSRISSTGPYANRGRIATLDLATLQSPGPPPTCALPSTPPNSYIGPHHSPTSSGSSPPQQQQQQQPGDVGVAAGLVARNPAVGVVLDRESRELCELTEQSYREWQGLGSGRWAPGRGRYSGGTIPPRSTAHRSSESVRVGSPVLEEVDLERMAGGY